MPTFSIRIERDNTAAFKAALPGAINKSLQEIGEAILDHVKDLVPVDTGALRDSYMVDVIENNKCVRVGSPLDYSAYVELGTGPFYEKPPDWVVNSMKQGYHTVDPWWYMGDDGEWHQGWFISSQPHLRPAFLNYVDEYKAIFKDNLENA